MSTEDAPFSRSQATHWRRQSYYSLFYGSFFEVSPFITYFVIIILVSS